MKNVILVILISVFTFCLSGQNNNDSLYKAVSINDLVWARSLLKSGADVNYVKSQGQWMKVNSLITAVNKGNFEMAKLLVENKADVNWKDGFNTTALMYAASKGSKDIVVLLVDNGADIKAEDGKGNTVLSAAKESKNNDLVKYIEDKLRMR